MAVFHANTITLYRIGIGGSDRNTWKKSKALGTASRSGLWTLSQVDKTAHILIQCPPPQPESGSEDSRACDDAAECVSAADPSKRVAEDEENGTLSLTPPDIQVLISRDSPKYHDGTIQVVGDPVEAEDEMSLLRHLRKPQTPLTAVRVAPTTTTWPCTATKCDAHNFGLR